MERIKEAVEKARAERGEAVPQVRPAREDAGNQESLERHVQYSQTKVVTARPEVMKRNGLISAMSDDHVRSAFKILRTKVEQRMTDQGWNACLVTSPSDPEGKTQVAINLAISLAWSMHRTVLLVDLDLRSPSIHKRFGIESAPGIIDYLVDDVPIKDLLFNPGIERLTVLPAGGPTERSSELLSSPKMSHLVKDLKARYAERLIVFDLPPILTSDDAIAFIPSADCAVLVAEDGKTTAEELTEASELLDGTELLGVCLNNCTTDSPFDE